MIDPERLDAILRGDRDAEGEMQLTLAEQRELIRYVHADPSNEYRSLDHAMEILGGCVAPYSGEQAQAVAKVLKQWSVKWSAAVDRSFDVMVERDRLRAALERIVAAHDRCARRLLNSPREAHDAFEEREAAIDAALEVLR